MRHCFIRVILFISVIHFLISYIDSKKASMHLDKNLKSQPKAPLSLGKDSCSTIVRKVVAVPALPNSKPKTEKPKKIVNNTPKPVSTPNPKKTGAVPKKKGASPETKSLHVVNSVSCSKQKPAMAFSQDPRKKLTHYLRHMENDFKLQDEEKGVNVRILGKTLEFLVGLMKKADPLFAFLYQRIFYTGSFYDGLRISSASEFDLNAVLALPFKPCDREVKIENNCPAYAKYQLRDSAAILIERMTKRPPPGLEKFFDVRNYLLPEKISSWIQSVLDKTFQRFADERRGFVQSSEDGVTEIGLKRSGPAWTLLISTGHGSQIDIDFVPVIEFKYPEWPRNARIHVPVTSRNGLWFLVPKPYKKMSSPLEPKDKDIPHLWRLHFPLIERELLCHRGFVKPIIKIFKRLRDQQVWHSISSYYLKTFVMWEVLDRPSEYWIKDMGTVFLELLRKLGARVKSARIPYLFYPELNLLRGMNQDEAANIENRINVILKKVESNPENIKLYLHCTCDDKEGAYSLEEQSTEKSICSIG